MRRYPRRHRHRSAPGLSRTLRSSAVPCPCHCAVAMLWNRTRSAVSSKPLNPEPARRGGVRDVPVVDRGRDFERREQVLQTPERLREHLEQQRALRRSSSRASSGVKAAPVELAQRRPRRSHLSLLLGGQRREVGHVPGERVGRRGDDLAGGRRRVRADPTACRRCSDPNCTDRCAAFETSWQYFGDEGPLPSHIMSTSMRFVLMPSPSAERPW